MRKILLVKIVREKLYKESKIEGCQKPTSLTRKGKKYTLKPSASL
jgi:hypothetical protein